MDDGFEALGLEEVEIGVGDEATDLEDLVGVRVKAGHLHADRNVGGVRQSRLVEG